MNADVRIRIFVIALEVAPLENAGGYWRLWHILEREVLERGPHLDSLEGRNLDCTAKSVATLKGLLGSGHH